MANPDRPYEDLSLELLAAARALEQLVHARLGASIAALAVIVDTRQESIFVFDAREQIGHFDLIEVIPIDQASQEFGASRIEEWRAEVKRQTGSGA